jgi:DNA-binding ferritin-like protein
MNFITNLLTLHNQFKVYHWQTQRKPGSYAQHIAFGTAYDDLTPLIDQFIEIYQGKKGVIMGKDGFTLNLQNLDDNPEAFCDEFIGYLSENVPQVLDAQKDTDLLNIRDEMMGILNQTKYRLLMK